MKKIPQQETTAVCQEQVVKHAPTVRAGVGVAETVKALGLVAKSVRNGAKLTAAGTITPAGAKPAIPTVIFGPLAALRLVPRAAASACTVAPSP